MCSIFIYYYIRYRVDCPFPVLATCLLLKNAVKADSLVAESWKSRLYTAGWRWANGRSRSTDRVSGTTAS